jgi:hypothetical protein
MRNSMHQTVTCFAQAMKNPRDFTPRLNYVIPGPSLRRITPLPLLPEPQAPRARLQRLSPASHSSTTTTMTYYEQ